MPSVGAGSGQATPIGAHMLAVGAAAFVDRSAVAVPRVRRTEDQAPVEEQLGHGPEVFPSLSVQARVVPKRGMRATLGRLLPGPLFLLDRPPSRSCLLFRLPSAAGLRLCRAPAYRDRQRTERMGALRRLLLKAVATDDKRLLRRLTCPECGRMIYAAGSRRRDAKIRFRALSRPRLPTSSPSAR